MADPLDALIEQALSGGGETTNNRAPDIRYDAQGQAYEFVNGSWVRNPTFDDPTQAAGYRPPSTAQAPLPQTYIDPATGDLVAVDARTGREVYRVPGAGFSQYSPQQERGFDLADDAAARSFATGERLGSEAFQGRENALDRAIRAGDLAASIGLQNEANRFAADQAYQQARERYTAQQLAGAQQVADNISNIDPGALDAFYEAGGGVIANALARGATAQSDRANLGSARALQAVEMAAPPERFSFNPVAYDPSAWLGFGGQTAPAQQQQKQPVTQMAGFSNVTPATGDIGGGPGSNVTAADRATFAASLNAGAGPSAAQQQQLDAFAAIEARQRAAMEQAGKLPRFAQGTGDIPAPKQFISGDAPSADPTAGGARPELVTVDDPEGNATLSVDPMVPPTQGAEGQMGALFRAIADFLDGGASPDVPRFAFGTDWMTGGVQPSDQPYLDRIRDVRTNVQFNELNPFDVGFDLVSPTLQGRHFQGRQTKYGVPVSDQVAEFERFRLPGASRGSFSLGF